MGNGKELINELNYRQLIEKMPPKELSQFTALQTYENNITLQKHETRLVIIESRLPIKATVKKQATFVTSVVTFVSLVLYTLGTKLGWWQ